MVKYFFIISLVIIITSFISSCDKIDPKDDLTSYSASTAPTITLSANSIVLTSATATEKALEISWTDPGLGADSASQKYLIEIDTTGGNFTDAVRKTVYGILDTSFTHEELNDIVLSYRLPLDASKTFDVRVTASYKNNNDRVISNTHSYTVTPYSVTPNIDLPTSLFLVGNATPGGWSNPVPVPSQEFTLNGTSFELTIQLTGGGNFLALPVNGSWADKYGNGCGSNGCNNTVEDVFIDGGNDFVAPATSGMYKIIFDFQYGRVKIQEI